MAWIYHQTDGAIYHDNSLVGHGYSGAGHSKATGRNNPSMEMLTNKGPIPQGRWRIGPSRPGGHLGPLVMDLVPVGHVAYYRDLFRIHGNNPKNDASNGCIILPPHIRIQIAASEDRMLQVVP